MKLKSICFIFPLYRKEIADSLTKAEISATLMEKISHAKTENKMVYAD